jgi:hypothetical protein
LQRIGHGFSVHPPKLCGIAAQLDDWRGLRCLPMAEHCSGEDDGSEKNRSKRIGGVHRRNDSPPHTPILWRDDKPLRKACGSLESIIAAPLRRR